jgi:hypothetical protein
MSAVAITSAHETIVDLFLPDRTIHPVRKPAIATGRRAAGNSK